MPQISDTARSQPFRQIQNFAFIRSTDDSVGPAGRFGFLWLDLGVAPAEKQAGVRIDFLHRRAAARDFWSDMAVTVQVLTT